MRHDRILLTIGLLSLATLPAMAKMPVPKLVFVGVEKFGALGEPFTRYDLKITNADAFAPKLFVPAPNLPPCGRNANSARAWVDVYHGATRLNGFCALASPADMSDLWFAVDGGETPPGWVTIEVSDRQTNQTVRSNRVVIPRSTP
jgi:hypothetical protein